MVFPDDCRNCRNLPSLTDFDRAGRDPIGRGRNMMMQEKLFSF